MECLDKPTIEMKKIILITAILCFINVTGYPSDNKKEQHRNWLIDSYHYGQSDNECSSIYYNYGTPKWTFNSDDPTLLKKLYEACKDGEKDKLSGQNSLPQLLDTFKEQ